MHASHPATSPPRAALSGPPILSVRGLTTEFVTRAGTFRAVDDVSFDLHKGEVLGVVGESGSGKSVTGLSLLGLVDHPGRIVEGEVNFDGRDLTQLTDEQLRRIRGRRIAMIFQDPMMTLNPTLKVETQMVEAIRAHEKVTRSQAFERCVEALETVGIPSARRRIGNYPHQFSGGMRQRVAIAIALLNNPDLIIADEPTTALDVTIQAQILHEVRRICRERGTSLIWVTHDLAIVAELADRVAVMYAGRIVEQGTTDDVLDRPQHPYTRGLLDAVPGIAPKGSRMREIGGSMPSLLNLPQGCTFRPRCFRAAEKCLVEPQLLPTPAGGEARCHFPLGTERPLLGEAGIHEETAAGTPILELRDVSKTFTTRLGLVRRLARAAGAVVQQDVVRAVDDVGIVVGRGEVVGLVGESGCGKSTLARIAAGLMPASSGEVRFHGMKGPPSSPGLEVQMVFQDPMSSLNPRLRVRRIVGEAPRKHDIVTSREVETYLDELLERVGLDASYKDRLPHQFSGGQRQRIGIARALAVKPDVLICDEAVSALDVSIQAQILNLLMDLREQLNLSILFISHDLGVVRHISDRVVVMYLGRIVESAPSDALFFSPNHPYTRALLAGMPLLERRTVTYETPKGELPSPLDPPSGCHFHPRCPFAFDRCAAERPALRPIDDGRVSACHLNDGPPGGTLRSDPTDAARMRVN